MSTENDTLAEEAEVSLDDFSTEFFGQNKVEPEPTKSEEVEEDDSAEIDAKENTQQGETEESIQDETDETIEDKDTLAEENEPEGKAKPSPKKSRAETRIEELNAKFRQEERARIALELKIEELQKQSEQNKKTEPTSEVEEDSIPKPTDKNEDGTDKYPLGEFDAEYMLDRVRYENKIILDADRASRDEAAEKTKQEETQTAAQAQLQKDWSDKLVPAQERYPDFEEKQASLVDTFDGIDQQYGDYLASTIMEMEHGPDVLYHLAENPDLAKSIVESGAKKATITLGRIEAQFIGESKPKVKVSKAPTPPPTNKGSSAARGKVRADTDDLDAFSSEFFKK